MATESNRTEKHGLFTLYQPAYQASECRVDIVAVHGLNGDAFKSWTDQDGHMWLRDSLPAHVPNARIMAYGYDAAVRPSQTLMHLHDFAQDLLDRLVMARSGEGAKRPLLFVCHSLGGLVVKQALVMAALSKSQYGSIVESASGIAFFGTPHRGSRTASPALILARIFNAASMAGNVRSDLIKTLETQSPLLDTLSRMSREILAGLSVVSFYEQKPHEVTGHLIVEPFSSILGIPNERAIPINADHRGITRLSPRHPNRYLPVWTSIKELVEKALLDSEQEYHDLMNAIFCVDYKIAQLRPRQPHQGTCDWVFGHSTFQTWFRHPSPAVLLLSAPPGFGKTVLTRHVMEEVMAGEQLGEKVGIRNVGAKLTISYFCSYHEQESNSTQTVLRSLLHQLLQLHPRGQNVVLNILLERQRRGFQFSFEVELLWRAIREVLCMDGLEEVFVIVDAIEELGHQGAQALLSGFTNMVEMLNRHVGRERRRTKFFFSSRPNANHKRNYPDMHILNIQRSDVERSIRKYIQDSVDQFALDESYFSAKVDEFGPIIVNKISLRADGMFLWASIAWDNFSHGIFWNDELLQQKLDDLEAMPPGINPLYERMLGRIEPSLRKDMLALFSILALAKRPLVEAELGEMLAVCMSKRQTLIRPNDVQPVQNIINAVEKHFCDLVEIHHDGTVLFSHLSFKEYLMHNWSTDRPEILEKARVSMAAACLGYIAYWDDLASDEREHEGLLVYSVRYHLSHLAALPAGHPLWLEFAKTADSGYFRSPRTSPAMSLLDSVLPSREDGILPIAKIHDLLRRFVANGYDLNVADIPEKTGRILNTCCSYGKKLYDQYGSTVPLLLELGADPNLYPKGEPSNLKVALRDGERDDVVEALLGHPEFDPNMTDDGGQTALHALIESGSTSKVIALLSRDYLSINTQDSQGRTALHLAISRAREEVIRPLLNYPNIKVHLIDINGRTPLALATWWGLSRIASMLIQRSGTNAQARSDSVKAILSAARHGQEDLVAALLPKTGYQNVNRDIDESGKSFLHHAAENNWEAIVTRYLEASDDININHIDNAGRTALHQAAHLGCTETARVLLRYGSRVNIQDRLGMNPPQLAAEAGFKDTLMVLLGLDDNQTYRPGEVNSSRWAAQVDANQRDHQGRNLVHWAATLDCLDVMQAVCREPGVELARKDNAGKIPIDYAWDCQCPQVGRYLAMRMRCAPLSASASSSADIYDWDGAYLVAAKKQRNVHDPDLLELVMAREAREKARETAKYATDKWALTNIPVAPAPKYEPADPGYNTSSGSGGGFTSQPPPSTYSPFTPQPEQADPQWPPRQPSPAPPPQQSQPQQADPHWQPPYSSPPPPPPRPQSSYYDPGPQPGYVPGHHQAQGTYHQPQPGYNPNYYPGQATYSEPRPGHVPNYYPGQDPYSEPQPGYNPDYNPGHAPYPGTEPYDGTQSYPGYAPSGFDSQPYPSRHPQPSQQYERDFTSNPYPSETSRPPNRLRRRKRGKQS